MNEKKVVTKVLAIACCVDGSDLKRHLGIDLANHRLERGYFCCWRGLDRRGLDGGLGGGGLRGDFGGGLGRLRAREGGRRWEEMNKVSWSDGQRTETDTEMAHSPSV